MAINFFEIVFSCILAFQNSFKNIVHFEFLKILISSLIHGLITKQMEILYLSFAVGFEINCILFKESSTLLSPFEIY